MTFALTTEDRHLLAHVSRWARANATREHGATREGVRWNTNDGRAVVLFSVDELHVGRRFASGHWYPDCFVSANSVAEAVDVLVALGILPAMFSSAYAAGQQSITGEGESL